jgi:hypothetical protein
MGEIKSTLDLVMEKTKHLSLSAKEKAGQQRDTYEKRIKGFLQKYADGVLTLEEFQIQLKSIQESLVLSDVQPLIRNILHQVDPEQDNALWLDLLEIYMPPLKDPTQEILATYRQRQETLLQAGMQNYLQQLKSQHRIQGPAVIPNLERDQEIQQELMLMRKEARDKLNILAEQSTNNG